MLRPHDLQVIWGTTGLVGTIAYRVVKSDDNTSLVARTTAGIAEFPAGSGNYHVENVEWDNSVDARVYWDAGVDIDTVSQYFPAEGLTVPSTTYPDGPTSDLFTYTEFVRRYGLRNITLASNKDNARAADPDLDAIQQAFDHATSEVYRCLRGGVYAVPLVFTTSDGNASNDIKSPAMTIAYGYLYEARGWEDKNRVGNKLERSVQMAYDQLGFIKAGWTQIEAQTASGVTLAGSAVTRQDILQDRIDNPVTVVTPGGREFVETPDTLP